MEPWKRVTTGDRVTEELQDNAEPIMKKVQEAFLLDGVLLKKETIATTATDVNHGLGRAPKGFIVIRRRGDATVWDLQYDSKSSAKTLTLIASAEVEVDLWVF